jgi:cytochrome P450
MLSVTKAADIQNILKNSSTHNVNPILAYHFAIKSGGKEPLTYVSSGKVWKMKRTIVHRLFVRNLEYSNPIFAEISVSLAKKLFQELGDYTTTKVYDIVHLMQLAALDNFGVLAFGQDLGCCKSLAMNDFALSLKVLQDDSSWRLSNILHPKALFYWLPSANNILRKHADSIVDSFFSTVFHHKQQTMREKGIQSYHDRDLVSLLLQDNVEGAFSIKTAVEVLRTTFFAAYTTISLGLGTAFWSVSCHPRVEGICLEEIRRVVGSNDLNFALRVNDLVYCRAVLLESLRLNSPVPLVSRILEKKAIISGVSYLSGTKIAIPTFAVHHDPDNFPRPKEFIPERWVKRRVDGVWEERFLGDGSDDLYGVPPANRNAFVAFSGGGRNCVGQKFALNEGTMLLAAVLREIQMEPVSRSELDVWLHVVTLEVNGGIPMVCKRRNPLCT